MQSMKVASPVAPRALAVGFLLGTISLAIAQDAKARYPNMIPIAQYLRMGGGCLSSTAKPAAALGEPPPVSLNLNLNKGWLWKSQMRACRHRFKKFLGSSRARLDPAGTIVGVRLK
jgi:hypothetical protein